jgi:hypothetical protein
MTADSVLPWLTFAVLALLQIVMVVQLAALNDKTKALINIAKEIADHQLRKTHR